MNVVIISNLEMKGFMFSTKIKFKNIISRKIKSDFYVGKWNLDNGKYEDNKFLSILQKHKFYFFSSDLNIPFPKDENLSEIKNILSKHVVLIDKNKITTYDHSTANILPILEDHIYIGSSADKFSFLSKNFFNEINLTKIISVKKNRRMAIAIPLKDLKFKSNFYSQLLVFDKIKNDILKQTIKHVKEKLPNLFLKTESKKTYFSSSHLECLNLLSSYDQIFTMEIVNATNMGIYQVYKCLNDLISKGFVSKKLITKKQYAYQITENGLMVNSIFEEELENMKFFLLEQAEKENEKLNLTLDIYNG